jgi:rSAM/selenodomain-associated transferase 2
MSAMPSLSIIIPVLDESSGITSALLALAPLRARGVEVVVVDGGSRDNTVERVAPHVDQVMTAPRGRAAQMNAGAAASLGDVLLFLHADTRLPPEADRLVLDGLSTTMWRWGRFDVRIEGKSAMLPVVAALMNWRSLVTGIATGDQAIFVARDVFNAIGGFPDLALMEDVALSKRLKRIGRPLCMAARVTTSGRMWDERGVIRTVLLMWRLRLSYWLGANPATLARRYGYAPRDS